MAANQSRYDRPTSIGRTGPGSGSAKDLNDRAQVVVAAFPRYSQAERVVDFLSDRGFPVEHVTIVGNGLHTVEQVTGRLTYWKAAARSALTGAIIGALFGWLFGLLNLINPLVAGLLLALYGLVFGAILGAVIGLLGHAMTGGRRDFASVIATRADTYEVMVDADYAAGANDLLRELPAPTAPGDAHR